MKLFLDSIGMFKGALVRRSALLTLGVLALTAAWRIFGEVPRCITIAVPLFLVSLVLTVAFLVLRGPSSTMGAEFSPIEKKSRSF
jgi:hypothetical protein